MRTAKRDALKAYLAVHGVATDIHYPLPVHLQTPYAEFARGPLPNTERLAKEILSLPIYPELADQDVDYVCELLRTHGA